MALNQHLQLNQSQRLVMTPMLQQALKILQLNGLELADMIQHELNENPMLEETAGEESKTETESGDENKADDETVESVTEEVDPGDHGVQDDSWEDYFEDNGTDYAGTYEHQDSDREGFESFLSAPLGLQEHLLRRLDAEDLAETARKAAEEIVGWIDERGYLSDSVEAISKDSGLPAETLFEALRVVQGLEPAGVGARNLRECLLLQLEAQGKKGGTAWKIVSDHLDAMARGMEAKIISMLGLDTKTMAEAKRTIASLEPVPGRPFGGEVNPAITVDGIVEKLEIVEKNDKGEEVVSHAWVVRLKDDYIPKLGINRYYRRMMREAGKGKETRDEAREYLKDRYQAAMWLIKGIEQRRVTLRKVLEAIVEVQQGFLEHGPAAFRPLALKDVAATCGVHESTVSRVTTNKYIQTPRGIFELKHFFSGGLKTDGGGEASSMAVKEKLKDLLEDEQLTSPLSDQALADELQMQGIRIARRTVAKYREEMKILPAHQRRRKVGA